MLGGPIQLAAIAFVTFHWLIPEGFIFGRWQRVLSRLRESGHEYIAKPLGDCAICFSGQIGFWGYVATAEQYGVIQHVCVTCNTMIFFYILTILYARFSNY